MDWCVSFPRENYIVSRPSLRKACGDNRNAGKFLSYLLFRASVREESKAEAKHINEVRKQQGLDPSQDDSITIYRTQGQIVHEMDDEISARTLRDEAIPCLIELGYLKIEEFRGKNQYTAYTILPEAIQHGINHPGKVPHFKTMAYYQQSVKTPARKNFRSEKFPNGSEKFPNGSEKFPNLEHEPLGKNSDPKSSDKSPSEAVSDGVHEVARYRDISKDRRRESEQDVSLTHSSTQSFASSTETKQAETPITEPPIANATPSEPIRNTTPSKFLEQAPRTEPLSQQEDSLSAEERRIQGYWYAMGFVDTTKSQEHWRTISKHVRSLEEMKSLYKHTQVWVNDNPRITDKQVHPGNLVHCLNGWKQAQTPLVKPEAKPKVKMTKEYLASLPL